MNGQTPAAASTERAPTERVVRLVWIVGAVFAILLIAGAIPRLLLHRSLNGAADAERERALRVATTKAHRAAEAVDVPLPGNVVPILEASIYARTDGYLSARYVDIGDRVVKGQQLADIDTPEIDQQLNQAIATLNESKANLVKLQADLTLAKSTYQRYVAAGVGTVSKQQIDERASAATDAEKAVDAGRATVTANEANVHRLNDLQGFQKVYAPFDGIITARNVDQGALISAGSTSGVRELYRLAQVNVLRVFVYVPQSYAPDIRVGQSADVNVREIAKPFTGTVTRTAGAIDPTSRTMLAEVQVPNPDGLLLSGSYATVHFKLHRTDPPMVIPSNALLINGDGVRVALLGDDATLRYRVIQVGRDYGNEVEVLAGVGPDDVLITGLSSNVPEGTRVKAAKATDDAGTSSPAPSGSAPAATDAKPAGGGQAKQ